VIFHYNLVIFCNECFSRRSVVFSYFSALFNKKQLIFINCCLKILCTSVEPDPVSRLRSNRILHFRTGSGLDWILKKLTRIRYGYPNCIDHCSKMLNQFFFGYKLDWIKYFDRSTGLGSHRITDREFWIGLGFQKSPICWTLLQRWALDRTWIGLDQDYDEFYWIWIGPGKFGTRKAEVLNSLIINTTAKANDTTDILQTFR